MELDSILGEPKEPAAKAEEPAAPNKRKPLFRRRKRRARRPERQLNEKKNRRLLVNARQLLERRKASNPKLVRELKKQRRLDEALRERVDRYGEVFAELVEKGLNPDQARELAEEELEVPPEANFAENPPTTA